MEAAELFENAMAWLEEHYDEFRFFAERDVVGTVQTQIAGEIESMGLPYQVVTEYSVLPGTRADLVIRNTNGTVEVAAEFKYVPSGSSSAGPHYRWFLWREVKDDVQRIQKYVEHESAKVSYSVFIDEGNHFHSLSWRPPRRSRWIDWGQGRWVLWTQASRG